MRLRRLFQLGKRLLKFRWLVKVLGVLALVLLIWFGGPLLSIKGFAPLETVAARVAIILFLFLGWLVWFFLAKIHTRKSNEKAVEELLTSDQSSNKSDIAQHDIGILQERITKALEILKNARFSQNKDIYHLPWYMLIGPPGSGKTTTLHNSGLDFPLRDQMGIDSIEGIGGTRQCDWWFTDKAVFIDTAGRYTTQDSHSQRDSGAWNGFLGLLRRHRPKRPINGVIVFVGLSDLLNQTRTERNLHARAVRQRILELQSQLGMTFPVYVLLTKADLIRGFTEFFEDLSVEESEQIWGMTFDPDSTIGEKGYIAQFNKEFHSLLNRLQARTLKRLQHESGIETRSAIYEFPGQLRRAQSSADEFLKDVFSPNPFEKDIMIRGVYIVSGTQEGVPIDQIGAQISHSFNLAEVPKRHLVGEGKGYFIRSLFEKIIIPERELASANLRHRKKVRWIRNGVLATTLISVVLLSVVWIRSYHWNVGLIEDVTAAVYKYQASQNSLLQSTDDLYSLNSRIQVLRSLPTGYDGNLPEGGPRDVGFYQGNKLGQSARTAYLNALEAEFGPFLANAMAEEMRQNAQHRDYLYETLRSYLMLFEPEHFDAPNILAWFEQYLYRQLPSELSEELRSELYGHMEAYLKSGLRALPYNEPLVAEVREELMAVPLAERAYQRIRTELLRSHVPDFRLSDLLGTDSLRVISRKSGAPLSEGIPGLFTYQGFHGLFNVQKVRVIRQLSEDTWVYGGEGGAPGRQLDSSLLEAVDERYYRDYVHYWQSLIRDIDVVTFESLEHGLFVTRTLAGNEQPIQRIIQSIQRQVELTKLPESDNGDLLGAVAGELTRTSSTANSLRSLLPDATGDTQSSVPGYRVEREFDYILGIEAEHLDHLSTVLNANRSLLEELYQPGNSAGQAFASRMQGRSSNEINLMLHRLREEVPEPFSSLVAQTFGSSSVLVSSGSREHINEAWRGTVLSQCSRAITNRYPVIRSSQEDINIRDFEQFFGYGGTLDAFFDQYLRPFVNTQRQQWAFNEDIGVSTSTLRFFQRAQNIREVFFPDGGRELRVGFSLRPEYLDDHIISIMVELDGQRLTYSHGPTRNTRFEWPGDQDRRQTRVVFTPVNSGLPTTIGFDGEWSWFRFLDHQARYRSETQRDGLLYLSEQGNRAQIQVLPDSVNNPFWSSELEGFRCPATL